MANSRLERLGTIFTRVTSLIKCGAMSRNDKPLWYEIYQAFPPLDEPSFSRRVPIKEVKPIFYPEDRIRAKFHRGNYVSRLMIDSLEGGIPTSDVTQKVISLIADIMKKEPNLSEDGAIQKAIDKFLATKAVEEEKPRSMFKSSHRKTSHVTTTVDMVDLPKKVDSRELKNIAQKDVNVNINSSREHQASGDSINFSNQLENDDDDTPYKRDSIVSDFKNASKKVSQKKSNKDDSYED